MFNRPDPFKALQPAIETTSRYLFKPFRFERWVVMGLLSFLMMCAGDGGSGGGMNYQGRGGGGDHSKFGGGNPPDLQEALAKATGWLHDHAALIGLLVLVVLGFALVLIVLGTWLGSRAGFVYLDNLRHDRHDLTRPWSEFADQAGSYFRWRLALSMGGFLLFVAISIPPALALWNLISSERNPDWKAFAGGAVAMLLLWLGACLLLAFAGSLLRFFLFDFVQPIQALRRCAVGPAAAEAWALIRANFGAVCLFIVLKFITAIGIGLLLTMLGLATCCVGFILMAIPVAGQALLQPVFVFKRALTLHFLEQFGPDYKFFPAAA